MSDQQPFRIREKNTFSWKCTAMVPEDGKRRAFKFDAKFEVMPQEELTALLEQHGTESGTVKALERCLINVPGVEVENEAGDLVPEEDAEERKRIILRVPYFVKALSDGYAAGVSGYKPKN